MSIIATISKDGSRPVVAITTDGDQTLINLWIHNQRADLTRSGYADDLQRFNAFTGSKPLRSLTTADLMTYKTHMEVTGSAPATIARRLGSIKSLVTFGCKTGYLPFNIGAVVKVPVVKNALVERISEEADIRLLMAAVSDNPRAYALLLLGYCAGLRIAEVASLRWKDLIARDCGGQVSVCGKGEKVRTILLKGKVWPVLMSLKAANAGPNDPVFVSREGGTLSTDQVGRTVKAAAIKAGINPDFSFHWLRHAHISHSLRHGADPVLVAATVGHASLSTTTRYAHARPDDSSSLYLTVC
jgi:integrase/recombinase XerD